MKLSRHSIERLGKRLVRAFRCEHVWDGIEVYVHEELASDAAHIPNFENHLARKLPLDAEVNLIRAADAIMWIEARIAVLVNAVCIRRTAGRGIRTWSRASQTRNNDTAANY